VVDGRNAFIFQRDFTSNSPPGRTSAVCVNSRNTNRYPNFFRNSSTFPRHGQERGRLGVQNRSVPLQPFLKDPIDVETPVEPILHVLANLELHAERISMHCQSPGFGPSARRRCPCGSSPGGMSIVPKQSPRQPAPLDTAYSTGPPSSITSGVPGKDRKYKSAMRSLFSLVGKNRLQISFFLPGNRRCSIRPSTPRNRCRRDRSPVSPRTVLRRPGGGARGSRGTRDCCDPEDVATIATLSTPYPIAISGRSFVNGHDTEGQGLSPFPGLPDHVIHQVEVVLSSACSSSSQVQRT